jgi:hypothetical protein
MITDKQAEKLKVWANKLITDNQKDPQEFDSFSFIDRNLTIGENKKILKDKLKESFGINFGDQTTKEEYFSLVEQELKKRIEEENLEIKESKVSIDDYYEDLNNAVEMLVNCEDINLLIVYGRGGTGKTTQVKRRLLLEGIENFGYFCGHITPFMLYRYLNMFSEKVVILDDSNPVLENSSSISLLMQSCDSRKVRVVMWNTSRSMDIEKQFDFKGKCIIITNKQLCDIYEPLLTRAIKCEVEFGNYQMYHIISKILEGKPYAEKILSILKNHINNIEINLRLFKMLEMAYLVLEKKGRLEKFDDMAKFIIKHESSEDFRLCFSLIKQTSDLQVAVKKFTEESGRSKMLFYKYRNIINKAILETGIF